MTSLAARKLAKELGADVVHMHFDARTGPELPDGLDETAWGCCDGAGFRGLGFCTCWQPVFDLDQHDPDLRDLDETAADLGCSLVVASQLLVVARPRCCDDCAYRTGSPERGDGYDEELRDIAGDGSRFFCHKGMRRVIGWKHPGLPDDIVRRFFPDGLIPAGPGDYRPPTVAGVAFRADGRPADLCAGWNAHRIGLAS